MEPDPISPEMPASSPRAPVTSPTSPKAPPMATSPRPTSPQSCLANESKADAMSARDLAVITILVAAAMLNPPNRPSKPVTAPISVRAPPMAERPLPIESQLIPPSFSSGSATILTAWAIMTSDAAVLTFNFIWSRALDTATSSAMAPPMPARPLTTPSKSSRPTISIAEASISMDFENAIRAKPVLMRSAVLADFIDLIMASRLRFSSAIRAPIAMTPPVTSPPLNAAIFSIEWTSTAMAPEISRSVAALTLSVKALSESPNPLRTSSKTPAPFLRFDSPLPKRLSTASLIVLKVSAIFFAAAKIPPPARPANISPAETFFEIHVIVSSMALLTHSHAFPIESPMVEATDFIAEPDKETFSVNELKVPMRLETVVPTFFAAPSSTPNCLIDLSSSTIQSPNRAAASRKLSSRFPAFSDPNAVAIASPTALTTWEPISKTEKTPLAIRPIRSRASSEGVRALVKSLNRSVRV